MSKHTIIKKKVIVGGMRVAQPKTHHESDVNNNKNKEDNISNENNEEEM